MTKSTNINKDTNTKKRQAENCFKEKGFTNKKGRQRSIASAVGEELHRRNQY